MKRFLFILFLILTTSIQARPGSLNSLGLSDNIDTPLGVDQAFVFTAQMQNDRTVLAHWAIAEGNYLYRDKIRFELIESNPIKLLPFSLPAGENKMDEIFGLSEVYLYDTDVVLPLKRSRESQQITLQAHYQGCSETFHICYPPVKKRIVLTLPSSDLYEQSNMTSINTATPQHLLFSEQDRIAKSLSEDNLFKIILSFFGLGLLLAFTPCAFPMFPILSSIIVGEGDRITTHRAFVLSLTYVLTMSITYAAAGVITGSMGENLQAIFQNPWIISSFSALFVILAISMFGLFELQLPHALQHRLHQMSHKQQGGSLTGVAIMGLLSGLIVGPCLAPPLVGALIFIGQQGEPVLGGLALFALSIGMGLPLLAIGTSAGSLLPKAGRWMCAIKSVFGILMLGLAIWMLDRIIPGWISLLLWGCLYIITAIYLGALTTLNLESSGWEKLWKGFGLILLIYGGLLLIGGASGSQNRWQPLQILTQTSINSKDDASAHLKFTRINNLTDLNQQLTHSNKPVMLDIYADWCIDCKRMKATTFKNDDVIAALADTTLLQLDMTDNSTEHRTLLKQLGIFGPPTFLFFNTNGHEYKHHRLVGTITASALIEHLTKLPQ